MNTLPFQNIPYESINSIGKQWIRRFALSLSKEVLGQVRSKFGSIPIPGATVNLNGEKFMADPWSENVRWENSGGTESADFQEAFTLFEVGASEYGWTDQDFTISDIKDFNKPTDKEINIGKFNTF